jgi:hypothetical protein
VLNIVHKKKKRNKKIPLLILKDCPSPSRYTHSQMYGMYGKPRRRITVTSSFHEISTDQLGNKVRGKE